MKTQSGLGFGASLALIITICAPSAAQAHTVSDCSTGYDLIKTDPKPKAAKQNEYETQIEFNKNWPELRKKLLAMSREERYNYLRAQDVGACRLLVVIPDEVGTVDLIVRGKKQATMMIDDIGGEQGRAYLDESILYAIFINDCKFVTSK